MQITINGELINKQICEQEMIKVRSYNPGLPEEQIRKKTAQNLVDWTLIRQEAMRRYPVIDEADINNAWQELKNNYGGEQELFRKTRMTSADEPAIKKNLEQNIRITRFLHELTEHIQPPDEDTLLTYFAENKEDFYNPEQVHAAQIFKPFAQNNAAATYREMRDIRNELLKGGDFADLANKCSSGSEAGGDLGIVSAGKRAAEFDTVVFSLQEGEISPVFLTHSGYHIVIVYKKYSATLCSFEECRGQIREKLFVESRDNFVANWVDTKKRFSDIKISYPA